MRKLLLLCAVLIGLVLSNRAQARSEYLEVLPAAYPAYEKSLTERSCAACHVSNEDFGLNLYGKQIAHELVAANTEDLSAGMLQKIETQDADGDGTTNIEEIKAGTDPGDPKSGGKPGVTAPPPQAATESAAPPKKKSLLPKNAYHPAIVHFPIALFIAGLALDFLGMLRNQKTLLLAGWYNLMLGALSTLGSIASGFLAMQQMRLPFSGLIFQHLALACIGSVLMWVMVALRIHRHEKMNAPLRGVYYILATAVLVLISYSAHQGGVFVYGE